MSRLNIIGIPRTIRDQRDRFRVKILDGINGRLRRAMIAPWNSALIPRPNE
jgi:hypothetical protein